MAEEHLGDSVDDAGLVRPGCRDLGAVRARWPRGRGGEGLPGRDLEAVLALSAQLIDQEVRRLIEEAEGKARQVLTDHLDDLHMIAKALLEYETLSNDEIGQILRGEKIVRDDTGGAGPQDRRRRASVPTSSGQGGTAPGGANPEPQPGV